MEARTLFAAVGLALALGAAGVLAWMATGGALPAFGGPGGPREPPADGARSPTPQEVPGGEAPAAQAPFAFEPAPLAFWRFEPRADGRYYARVEDASGRGHHGLLVGDVEPRAGPVGRAAWFGGNASMWVPNGTVSLHVTGSWSFAAWVSPEDEGSHLLLEKAQPSSDARPYGVWLEGGSLRYRHGLGEAAATFASEAPVTPGRWTHVAVVRDAEEGSLTLYVDGRPLRGAYDAEPSGDPRAALWVGGQATDPGGLRGGLDEAGVWDVPLRIGEVQALTRAGRP